MKKIKNIFREKKMSSIFHLLDLKYLRMSLRMKKYRNVTSSSI